MRIRRLVYFFLLVGLDPGAGIAAHQYSMQPPQVHDLSPQSDVVNTYNWRQDIADLHAPGGVVSLPAPRALPQKIRHLSVREAILLALRNNPTIQSADLSRVVDKFALIVAHNAFEPQYSLGSTATYVNGAKPRYTTNAGINLKTTLGTQLGFSYGNVYSGTNGSPGVVNFSVTQPLLKGFGTTINLIPWLNALDSENQARLNFKGTMMAEVTAVISSYYQLVQDYQNIAIQEHTLANNARTVKESELRLKVGQLAASDVMQQKATYQTTQLALLQQKSALILDYQSFLTLLGLKASAQVEIDKKITFEKVKVPSLEKAIQLALKGNVDYQKQLIAIRATERAVIAAKDAARWQLNMTGNFTYSGTNNQIPPQPISVNGVTALQPFVLQSSPSLMFSLDIPINNVQEQQAVVDTEVQLAEAKLALENLQLTLTRQITNDIQQIHNQQLTLKAAEAQVKFQQESFKAIQIKYRYGRTTTFEMNQIQDQLLTQATTLVMDRVTLINQITALYQDLGLTLQQWDITLRY